MGDANQKSIDDKILEGAFLDLLEEVRTYDAPKRKRNLHSLALKLTGKSYDIQEDVKDYLFSNDIEEPMKEELLDAVYSGAFQEPFVDTKLSAEGKAVLHKLQQNSRKTDESILPLLHKESREKALQQFASAHR